MTRRRPREALRVASSGSARVASSQMSTASTWRAPLASSESRHEATIGENHLEHGRGACRACRPFPANVDVVHPDPPPAAARVRALTGFRLPMLRDPLRAREALRPRGPRLPDGRARRLHRHRRERHRLPAPGRRGRRDEAARMLVRAPGRGASHSAVARPGDVITKCESPRSVLLVERATEPLPDGFGQPVVAGQVAPERSDGRPDSPPNRAHPSHARRWPSTCCRMAGARSSSRCRARRRPGPYGAPTIFLSAPSIASGAQRIFMKLFAPIIERSGKLTAIRNFAWSAYTSPFEAITSYGR
jgi:hypothetical protein